MFSRKKERKKINCQIQMMKSGRITISKTLSVQILSEIFTIKGLTHKAHVRLRLSGKNCAFKILQNLWLSTIRCIPTSKYAAPQKSSVGGSGSIRPGMKGLLEMRVQITKQVDTFNVQGSFSYLSFLHWSIIWVVSDVNHIMEWGKSLQSIIFFMWLNVNRPF